MCPDGTWSGNLYDFYRKVILKLTADLKVPLRLRDGVQRVDETHVHEAIREALVNTLIHADYEGRVSTLMVKRPEGFTFRNPGGLRLPVEQIRGGGVSDCRNRTLQKMFFLLGMWSWTSPHSGSAPPAYCPRGCSTISTNASTASSDSWTWAGMSCWRPPWPRGRSTTPG